MSKHTPGPWIYKPTSGRDYGSTIYWIPDVCHNIETEANARLISGAPDLLMALQGFVNHFSGYDEVDPSTLPLFQFAEDAIAKATGDQA